MRILSKEIKVIVIAVLCEMYVKRYFHICYREYKIERMANAERWTHQQDDRVSRMNK